MFVKGLLNAHSIDTDAKDDEEGEKDEDDEVDAGEEHAADADKPPATDSLVAERQAEDDQEEEEVILNQQGSYPKDADGEVLPAAQATARKLQFSDKVDVVDPSQDLIRSNSPSEAAELTMDDVLNAID